MTIVTPDSGGFYYPLPRVMNQQSVELALTIDAADEQVAGVFQAPFTGTIDKVIFATQTVTTGATVDVRLETVSLSDGDPTGTLLGTNSNASQVIADGDDNTTFTVTLTTGVAVTKGDYMAVTIVNPTTSFGDIDIIFGRTSNWIFPYADIFTGTWSKQTRTLNFALEYSDGSYHFVAGNSGWTNGANSSFDNASTLDERGNRFNFPFPTRITGFWFHGDIDGDTDAVLYDSSDVAQLTLTLDPQLRENTAIAGPYQFLFSGTLDVSTGDFVRFVLKPTTTTNISIILFTFASSTSLGNAPGGTDIIRTGRTDAGTFADINTERFSMGLILSGFDDASGGGGGVGKLIGAGGGLIG